MKKQSTTQQPASAKAKSTKKQQEKLSAEDLKKILGGRNAVDPFNRQA
jgi:hypothetical protein